ncbi:hypothetical protein TNCV_2742251 [Trichonephila clavipes]|nr:hypothetical protein TNCV_2742251 [Trichonephila clavipes]
MDGWSSPRRGFLPGVHVVPGGSAVAYFDVIAPDRYQPARTSYYAASSMSTSLSEDQITHLFSASTREKCQRSDRGLHLGSVDCPRLWRASK